MDLVIRGARLRGVSDPQDVGIEHGRIASVAGRIAGGAAEEVEADGRLLVPGFVNMHCHLDKCLTGAWSGVWQSSGSGSPEAIPAAAQAKGRFTESDVMERASAALATSIAAGTTTMRAFADVDTVGGLLSVRSLLKVKERFKDSIRIQVVAFPQEGILRDEGTQELLEKSMELGADVVGAIPWYEKSKEDSSKHMDVVFEVARKFDRDVHALVDDNSDPESRNIEGLLARSIRVGWRGRVAASHCRGGLDSPDNAYAERIVALAKEARATVVENSHVSLFMYGRSDPHPVRRGVTRVKEFLRGGVNVAVGQDDIDDPYYPFGRGDMLELAFIMCHAAHLGTPEEIDSAFDMVTGNAARGMRLDRYGTNPGDYADLVLLDAPSVREAMRLQPAKALVLKRGRVVSRTRVARDLNL